MVSGVFKSFRHEHYFDDMHDGATVMRDVLEFSAPLRPLGILVERLVLRRYMTTFLVERNAVIKHIAESEQWKSYLDS